MGQAATLFDVPDADRAAAIRYLVERLDTDSFEQFRQRLRVEHPTLEKEMTTRFGSLSPEHAARINTAEETSLNTWIELVITAPTPEATLA